MTFPESYSPDGNLSPLSIVIDTSQKEGCILILDKDFNTVFKSFWSPPLKHSERVLSEYKECKKLLLSSHLKKIYFINGPGSFTGLRVGASFAKALSLAFNNCPIVTSTSFLSTAFKAAKENPDLTEISVCIPSIGNKIFKADYSLKDGLPQTEKIQFDGAFNLNKSAENLFTPNVDLVQKEPFIKPIPYDEPNLIKSLQALDSGLFYSQKCTHLDLYPLYLRKSEAEEKYNYDKVKLPVQEKK